MNELVGVWVFFFWLTGGSPDGVRGPFETREACLADRATAPPQVLALSECVRVLPVKRTDL